MRGGGARECVVASSVLYGFNRRVEVFDIKCLGVVLRVCVGNRDKAEMKVE